MEGATKLLIIDLATRHPKDQTVIDLVNLLEAWNKDEQTTEKHLAEELEKLEKKYQTESQTEQEKVEAGLKGLEAEVAEAESIGSIKDDILSNK